MGQSQSMLGPKLDEMDLLPSSGKGYHYIVKRLFGVGKGMEKAWGVSEEGGTGWEERRSRLRQVGSAMEVD